MTATYNLPVRRLNAATANWTPERCEQLAKLWAEGLSGSQIAAALGDGATRCGVIGKVHRLGLASRRVAPAKSNLRYEPKAARPPTKKRPKKAAMTGGNIPAPWVASRLLPVPLPGEIERLKGSAWAPLPGSDPKPLLAVAEADGCRWPIGETRPYLFCGEPIHARSFCKDHHAIAFVRAGKADTRLTGKFKDSRILDEETA